MEVYSIKTAARPQLRAERRAVGLCRKLKSIGGYLLAVTVGDVDVVVSPPLLSLAVRWTLA